MSEPCVIALTRGQVALVDAADYPRLTQWSWHAVWNKYTNSFYALRTEKRGGRDFHIGMHREVMGLEVSDKRQVDHRSNPDTLDNRRSNLRVVTVSQNRMNSRPRKDRTSGFRGAFFHKPSGRWKSAISVNRKVHHLGYFPTAELAHQAYCAAVPIHHGSYGRTD